MGIFKNSDERWYELAVAEPGPVWVVGLGMEVGMGTSGSKENWTTIINTIESAGWRLEHMTSVSAGANALMKTNGNMYATFRRVSW